MQRQPTGEITNRLDSRKVPAPSGPNRLHALRFGEPLGDVEFPSVFGAGTSKSSVFGKEPNDVTMARARSAAEGLKIAMRERAQPAPRAAQRPYGPRVDAIDSRLPCEKAPGKDTDYGGSLHGLKSGEDSNQSDSA